MLRIPSDMHLLEILFGTPFSRTEISDQLVKDPDVDAEHTESGTYSSLPPSSGHLASSLSKAVDMTFKSRVPSTSHPITTPDLLEILSSNERG